MKKHGETKATGMQAQIKLLTVEEEDTRSDIEKAAAILGDKLLGGIAKTSHGGNGVHRDVPALPQPDAASTD